MFHFDRWWNPAVENQATDRAFRIGQTRRVQVHKFVCVGTLEEKIDEMIEAEAGDRRLGHRQRRGVAHEALECRAEGAIRPSGRCVRRMIG